ncbi:MAG: hypothetical protein RQM92_03825 [Candidatus Syntrophopropionicum ammoniitolerans]
MRTTPISVRKRITYVFMIAIVFFSMLIIRVGYLQLVEGDRLRDEAMDVRMRDVPLEAKRGDHL